MTDVRRPRGRPPIGERVSVRVPSDLLKKIDALAADGRESRANAIRRLLEEGLSRRRPDGVDRAQIQRMLALTPRARIRHMVGVARGSERVRVESRRSR